MNFLELFMYYTHKFLVNIEGIKMKFYFKKMDSPIGVLYVVATFKHLVGLSPEIGWDRLKKRYDILVEKENDIINKTQYQLDEYFAGIRQNFDIPIFLNGTEFQISAWNALLKIPYGETITYQQQAKNINRPKAVRAIGVANGANPISIIVPCHRVIGKSGKLTGYAGGLDIKRFLLELESFKGSSDI